MSIAAKDRYIKEKNIQSYDNHHVSYLIANVYIVLYKEEGYESDKEERCKLEERAKRNIKNFRNSPHLLEISLEMKTRKQRLGQYFEK